MRKPLELSKLNLDTKLSAIYKIVPQSYHLVLPGCCCFKGDSTDVCYYEEEK